MTSPLLTGEALVADKDENSPTSTNGVVVNVVVRRRREEALLLPAHLVLLTDTRELILVLLELRIVLDDLVDQFQLIDDLGKGLNESVVSDADVRLSL